MSDSNVVPFRQQIEQVDRAIRVPAHVVDAENAIVGGLFVDPARAAEINDLQPDAFSSARCRVVFATILDMHHGGEPIDEITVADKLHREGMLDKVGGLSYLAELAKLTPTSAHAIAHARIVIEHAKKRAQIREALGLGKLASEIQKVALSDEPDFQVIGKIAQKIEKDTRLAQKAAVDGRFEEAKLWARGRLAEFEYDPKEGGPRIRLEPMHFSAARYAKLPPPQWIFPKLWNDRTFIMIGGEPKSAKTLLAMTIMLCVASGRPLPISDDGIPPAKTGPVFVFCAEDSVGMVVERFQAMMNGLGLTDSERAIVDTNLTVLPRQRMDLFDHETHVELCAWVYLFSGDKPAAIMIDPVKDTFGLAKEDNDEMGRVGEQLRKLRDVFDCGVLGVHHMVKSNDGKRGNMALRGGASLAGKLDGGIYFSKTDPSTKRSEIEVEVKDGSALPPFSLQPVFSVGDDGRATSITWQMQDKAAERQQTVYERKTRLIAAIREHGPVSTTRLYTIIGGGKPNIDADLKDLAKDPRDGSGPRIEREDGPGSNGGWILAGGGGV